MAESIVSATEFKSKFGAFSAQVHKGPVIVTTHNRPLFVALDPDEYRRLLAADTRKAYKPEDVPEDMLAALKADDPAARDKHLDYLTE